MKKAYLLFGKFLNLDVMLGVICLSLLIAITFIGTISRYFFRVPIIGVEEIQNWMIIWAIFFGSSYVFRKGSHITIDIIVNSMPQKLQIALEFFSFLCVSAVLFFVYTNSLTLNMQFFERGRSTPILSIPNYVIFGMVTVGSIWMIISYAYRLVGKYFLGITEEKTAPGEGGEIA